MRRLRLDRALAALQARPGPALAPPVQRRHVSSEPAASHYAVLGVTPQASTEAIKAAFREKAKLHHPDAAGTDAAPDARQRHVEWNQVLTAYAVLKDARCREMYDLSRAAGTPGVLRRAAATGINNAGHDEEEIELSWGMGFLRRSNAAAAGDDATALDRLRGELHSDVHAALRHAYLGPRLVGLQAGQLPGCFEADERSTQDTPDVLQLVSGRQLLGAVRQWQPQMLSHQERRRRLASMGIALNELPGGAVAAGTDAEKAETSLQAQHLVNDPASAPASPSAIAGSVPVSGAAEEEDEVDLLELTMKGEVLASAVRIREGLSPRSEQLSAQQPAPAPVRVYRDGRLIAQLEAADSPTTSNAASAARLLDAQGRHTHTVLRSVTPLVRHLTFVSELASTQHKWRRRGGGGGGGAVVARCRRAWLPPSSLWLFRPLSYDHDAGGWYVEWAGHENEAHPAWLDPGIITLAAAFDTLDHERAARQPQGLFARLRQGDETSGGVRAWVKAMLRFHRLP